MPLFATPPTGDLLWYEDGTFELSCYELSTSDTQIITRDYYETLT